MIRQRSFNWIHQFYQSIIPFWCLNSRVLLCVPPTSLLNPVAIFTNVNLAFSRKKEFNIYGFFRRIVLIAYQIMCSCKYQIFRYHKSWAHIGTNTWNIKHQRSNAPVHNTRELFSLNHSQLLFVQRNLLSNVISLCSYFFLERVELYDLLVYSSILCHIWFYLLVLLLLILANVRSHLW